MTAAALKEMSGTDIKTVEVTKLVGIETVQISLEQEVYTRVQKFIDQIGNPYCFMADQTPVKISFSNTGSSLEDEIFRYFRSLNE